jgi:hypothetical protein
MRMYVDEKQNQFCVDADKASGDFTFYMPASNSTNVTNELMDFYFNHTPLTDPKASLYPYYSNATKSYVTGDPIGDYQFLNLNKYFTIPKSNGFGGCEFGHKVLFNVDEENECELKFTTSDMCTSFLNPEFALIEMLVAPLSTAGWIKGTFTLSSSTYDASSSTCMGALLGVSYQVRYIIDKLGGFKIQSYKINPVLGNLTLGSSVKIKSSVRFYKDYPASEGLIKTSSGNPGYLFGLPLIFKVASQVNYFPLDISNEQGLCFTSSDFSKSFLT